jgi:hypothetical protein
LFTQQEAESLQRTGTASGIDVSVRGQVVLASRPIPGFTINRVDENELRASGRVVTGVLMLTGTGRYRASGTFSIEGQSGAFTASINLSSTATFRRPGTTSNGGLHPMEALSANLRTVLEKIRRRSR